MKLRAAAGRAADVDTSEGGSNRIDSPHAVGSRRHEHNEAIGRDGGSNKVVAAVDAAEWVVECLSVHDSWPCSTCTENLEPKDALHGGSISTRLWNTTQHSAACEMCILAQQMQRSRAGLLAGAKRGKVNRTTHGYAQLQAAVLSAHAAQTAPTPWHHGISPSIPATSGCDTSATRNLGASRMGEAGERRRWEVACTLLQRCQEGSDTTKCSRAGAEEAGGFRHTALTR